MSDHMQAQVKGKDGEGYEIAVQRTSTDAPILPAANLEHLKRIDPKLVDIVVEETRIEAQSRRVRQRRIDHYIGVERLARPVLASAIALFGLWAAFTLGMAGHEIAASVLGGGTLVGIVTVLHQRRHEPPKDAKPPPQQKGKRR